MRKFIGMFMAVIFAVSLILNPVSAEACHESETYIPVITEHRAEESEEFIWNELSKYSPSEFITAGIMGYFWRESYMRSDAVAGWPTRNLGLKRDICETFTEKVDSGLDDGSSKDYFLEMVQLHYGGYGLGQWLGTGYLEHFYEFVRERDGSIADAVIQCEFIFESIQKNEELWELLLKSDDPGRCGRQIAYMYDGTGSDGANTIGAAATIYYKRFNTECDICVS